MGPMSPKGRMSRMNRRFKRECVTERRMITIEECVHLLACGLVSELYLPEVYCHEPMVMEMIHLHLWFVMPSELAGWVRVRRRMHHQD